MSDGQKLLERARELERVESALAGAADGEGSLLLVEGPAGIGKTALLEAARTLAGGAGTRVLAARATEIERDFPYGAIRQLLEPPLRAASAERRRELLAGAAAPAAAVLGIDAAVGARPDPGPGSLHALHWLLANLAEEAPCLLVLDDAQWADPDSLRFLAFLSPRLGELPITVAVAARTEEPTALAALAATASDPASRPLALAALSASAIEAILAASFGSTVDGEFARACHEATGGNPFYLRALVDVLREDGVPPTAQSAGKVLTLGPKTVTRAIFTRVARLPAPASDLARALAVLGDGADLRHAAALARVEVDDARTSVDRLISASILAGSGPLRFAHPILANAVYADIGPAERTALHARAAVMLAADQAAPELIAAHLLVVEPGEVGSAVATLRAAAAEAVARGAPVSAVAHLRRALAEAPGDEVLTAILVELGMAEMTIDGSAATEHLRAALARTDDPEDRTQIVRALAQASFSLGDADAGIRVLRDELDAGGPEALEVDLVAALSMGVGGTHLREADERLERIAPGLSGESPSERRALDCLGFCRLRRGEPVAEVVGPLVKRLERTPDDERLSPVELLMTVGTLTRCDRIDLAETWAHRGLREARETGSIYGMGAAHWLLGGVSLRRGSLADAVSDFEASLRGAQQYGAQAGVQSSLCGLLDALVDRGDLERAIEMLAAAGLEAEIPEQVAPTAELLESRARLHLARDDGPAALRDFAAAGELFRDRVAPGPGLTAWRSGAARAHLRLGNRDAAGRMAH